MWWCEEGWKEAERRCWRWWCEEGGGVRGVGWWEEECGVDGVVEVCNGWEDAGGVGGRWVGGVCVWACVRVCVFREGAVWWGGKGAGGGGRRFRRWRDQFVHACERS